MRRTYTPDFRIEAVRLAGEIGPAKAARELNIPEGTMDVWVRKAKDGTLNGGKGAPLSPKSALTLAEEVKRLKQENGELRRVNEILSKAAAFFAQSQKK